MTLKKRQSSPKKPTKLPSKSSKSSKEPSSKSTKKEKKWLPRLLTHGKKPKTKSKTKIKTPEIALSASSQAAKTLSLGKKIKPAKKKESLTIIYLSPKTKKPLKTVRVGQEVLYGVKRGKKITVIHDEAQEKNKELKKWLTKHIDSSPDDYMLFFKKSNKVYKDGEKKLQQGEVVKRGVIKKRVKVDKKEVLVSRKKSMLTIPKLKTKLKASYYHKGKMLPITKKGFFERSRNEISASLSPRTFKTGKTVSMVLKGTTIAESIGQILIDKNMRGIKKNERVFFTFTVSYVDANGQRITLSPASGVDTAGALRDYKGKFASTPMRLANLTAKLSKAVRTVFTTVGMRYTTTKALNTIEAQMDKQAKALEAKGEDDKAEKLYAQMDRIMHPTRKTVGPYGPRAQTMSSIYPETKGGEHKKIAENEAVTIDVTFSIEESK